MLTQKLFIWRCFAIFSDSVQQEVRKFYSSLNVEEKAQLKNFAKTSAANFSLTDSQFMDGLKVDF